MERLAPREFLAAPGALVDVRAPAEFEGGHVPGAVSIPLFDDEERAVVGTAYKQRGRKQAIDEGFAIAGPRLRDLAERGRRAADGGSLRVYCWRGGMRSRHMGWLFEAAEMPVTLLEGGYKAYRRTLLEDFGDLPRLIVLQGATGSGKTEILAALAGRGEQVIDLEALASHRGSVFGALGMPEQPSTQQFQNRCHAILRGFDRRRRSWVEGESKSIGRCHLPETLWTRMNEARLLEIEVPREERVRRLVRDYGGFDVEVLAESIRRIGRRLGGQHVKRLIDRLGEGDTAAVAAGLLDYYDSAYAWSREKYKRTASVRLELAGACPARDADRLIEKAETEGW